MLYLQRRNITLRDYGRVYTLGGATRIIIHPTYVWYFDGEHSVCFAGVLFPDGTEWWPVHDASNG